MSDDFGFDPAELFRRSRERRPSRVLRTGPRFPRWQRIVGVAVAIVIAVIIVFFALIGLRVRLLFLDSLGHSNVFWTPLGAQVLLFVVGFLIAGGLVGASVPVWLAVAANLRRAGPRSAVRSAPS